MYARIKFAEGKQKKLYHNYLKTFQKLNIENIVSFISYLKSAKGILPRCYGQNNELHFLFNTIERYCSDFKRKLYLNFASDCKSLNRFCIYGTKVSFGHIQITSESFFNIFTKTWQGFWFFSLTEKLDSFDVNIYKRLL